MAADRWQAQRWAACSGQQEKVDTPCRLEHAHPLWCEHQGAWLGHEHAHGYAQAQETRAQTGTHTHALTPTLTNAFTHTPTLTHACRHAHTHIHTLTHTLANTYTRAHTYTHTCACRHTYLWYKQAQLQDASAHDPAASTKPKRVQVHAISLGHGHTQWSTCEQLPTCQFLGFFSFIIQLAAMCLGLAPSRCRCCCGWVTRRQVALDAIPQELRAALHQGCSMRHPCFPGLRGEHEGHSIGSKAGPCCSDPCCSD